MEIHAAARANDVGAALAALDRALEQGGWAAREGVRDEVPAAPCAALPSALPDACRQAAPGAARRPANS